MNGNLNGYVSSSTMTIGKLALLAAAAYYGYKFVKKHMRKGRR